MEIPMLSEMNPQPEPREIKAEEQEFTFTAVNPLEEKWLIKINDRIRNSLSGTRPWVRVAAVCGIVWSCLGVLGGGFHIYFVLAVSPDNVRQPQLYLGIAIIIFSLFFYLLPALKLFGYSASLGRVLRGGGLAEMEIALEKQRSLWITVGLLFALATLLMVGSMFFPVVMELFGLSPF